MKIESYDILPQLKPYIHYIRNFEINESEVSIEKLSPHPLPGLILQYGDKAKYNLLDNRTHDFATCYFAFPILTKHKLNFQIIGNYKALIIVFTPGGFNTLFKYPLINFIQTPIIDFNDLVSTNNRMNFNWAFDTNISTTQKSTLIQLLLCGFIKEHNNISFANNIASEIFNRQGIIDIHQLANKYNITERTLERNFLIEHGVNPYYYSRIVRCHLLLKDICCIENPDWLDLVIKYGYHDKAHLVNDFKKIIGVPPATFARSKSIMEKSTR